MEGQHQSPLELVSSNLRAVLNDVINKLESRHYSSNIDYVRYKIDWICTLLVRLGGTLEESVLPYLLEAAWMLAVIDQENDESSICSPTEVKSGFRGRPKFDISNMSNKNASQGANVPTSCISLRTPETNKHSQHTEKPALSLR